MCEATTLAITGGVMAAGSLGMNFMGKQSAANAAGSQAHAMYGYQNRLQQFRNDRYLRQATSIKKSVGTQINAMLERADQMRDQAFFNIERAAKGAKQASAALLVSRDETTGRSVTMLQNEAARLEAEMTDIIWTNLQGEIRHVNRGISGIYARGQSALEQAYPDPMAPLNMDLPSQPNPLSLIMGLGSIGVGSYANYAEMQALSLQLEDATP